MDLKKSPTGIESLDPVLQGGFPSGSLVLLLGEMGAGEIEFAISSIARLLNRPKQDTGMLFPNKVCYVSLTRGKDDVMKEIALSFPEFYNVLKDRLEFKDFSESFFARSFIPINWRSSSQTELTFESLKWCPEEENLIVALIDYLDKKAYGSIVIIDSLTVLAQHCLGRMEWKDLIIFLRGLQKASKKWDGLVYTMLTEGIFEKSKQEEILDCMDAVIVFEWDKQMTSKRQRIMYMKKFRGLLPVLDQDNIVNFETQISSQKGFEVSNIKRVRGR
jgi:KaiC/GvpD/RAD55 family RecA-like ATPase